MTDIAHLKPWLICWISCSSLPAVTNRHSEMQHSVFGKGRQAAAVPAGYLHSANTGSGCSTCHLAVKSVVSDADSTSGTGPASLLGSPATQVANLCKSLTIPEFAMQKACVCYSQSSCLQCSQPFVLYITITVQNEMLGRSLQAPSSLPLVQLPFRRADATKIHENNLNIDFQYQLM